MIYPIPAGGKFQIYIGKAPAGMRNRSAAGDALRGGPPNGWAYLAVTKPTGNQVPMADLRARLLATKTQPGT